MPLTRSAAATLALLFCVQEAVLLAQYAGMRVPFHPAGYDQVDYLLVLARMVAPDSPEGLLDLQIAQGWLLHLLAWPWAMFGLPPVLAFHLPLLGLELGLFLVARRHGAVLGWLALGLFLSARAHEPLIGGPVDYRHDYLAMILFGGTALAAWAAAPFHRRGPVLLAGVLAGLTVHARFLTAAYLLAALPWLVASIACGPGSGRAARRALGNLGLGLLAAVLIALPFYLCNRDAIHDYYLQGHLVSTREAAARGFAGLGWQDFLSYYTRNLFRHQLGAVHGVLGLLVLAAACGLRWRAGVRLPWARLLVVGGFLMPLPVLCLGLQRNHVVASVMVLPVTLGIVTLAAPLAAGSRARVGLLLAAGAGLLTYPLQVLDETRQVHAQRVAARHDAALAGLREIARALPVDRTVAVSALGLHEALSASMLRWLRVGERGRWGADVVGELGHTIYRLPPDELRDRLRASDLVLVPDGLPEPAEPLPSQVQLRGLRDGIAGTLAAGWRRAAELDFPLDGGTVRVWIRPP